MHIEHRRHGFAPFVVINNSRYIFHYVWLMTDISTLRGNKTLFWSSLQHLLRICHYNIKAYYTLPIQLTELHKSIVYLREENLSQSRFTFIVFFFYYITLFISFSIIVVLNLTNYFFILYYCNFIYHFGSYN